MNMETERRTFLLRLFEAGLAAVRPSFCLPPHLPRQAARGRTLVLGAGKAAASMAAALRGGVDWPLSGLVVTRYGHGVGEAIAGIEVIEAGHPVPDRQSRDAARRMLDLAHALGPDDRLIFLASGGGSATLSLPVAGLGFEDKRALVRHLVLSGAAIDEINCVRKHLSAIKGGRLAAAAGAAEILTYAISDVPGDDPSGIASGPTAPDHTTLADARAVIARYGCPNPEPIARSLADPANETPKAAAQRARVFVVARARDCLDAAARVAAEAGIDVVDLGDRVEGDSCAVGREQARLARILREQGRRALILSGGETTVAIRNAAGRGGPNLEFLMGFARELGGLPGIHALACDSDGIDGSEDAAGAIVTPSTLDRAAAAGVDIDAHLESNDSYRFFAATGDLVVTGPTLTNVNDFRAVLVEPAEA